MPEAIDKFMQLIDRFKNRDRKALAKVITIIESSAIEARKDADHILSRLSPHHHKTIRVAVSGPPGVGKSTFINTLGRKLIEKQYYVAILPIDPSSEVTHGSILADKTRMKDLLSSDRVFIRPSPSKGALGGVAVTTKDVVFVVEAFGCDFVVIETVGVGQSETVARSLADHFVLLMQPGSGDQLQAMKKGILERADFILINKADDEQEAMAKRTESSILASRFGRSHHDGPYVASISALKDTGIDEFLEDLSLRHQRMVKSGELLENRKKQFEELFYYSFEQALVNRIKSTPKFAERCRQIVDQITSRDEPLSPALNRLLDDICQKF